MKTNLLTMTPKASCIATTFTTVLLHLTPDDVQLAVVIRGTDLTPERITAAARHEAVIRYPAKTISSSQIIHDTTFVFLQ